MKECDEIFTELKKSKFIQWRILYLSKLSFRNEGEIKIFPDKQKLKVYISTVSAL
jgi:hypothetical protein